MATHNVTVSVDDAILAQARTLAASAGLSLSAYAARAVQAQVRRDAARAYTRWTAEPDVAADIDAIRAERALVRGQRRAEDAEDAAA